MIRIESRPTPEAISRLEHLESIRREQLEAKQDLPPSVAEGYRDPRVKESIVAETNGKCAYCESKMRHVDWGDVEHIDPKSKYPDRLLDYSNLTLACAVCNGNKSDYDDPACQLLNPYVDDVDANLFPLGPLIWHRPAATRGETTVVRLRLNRSELVQRREQRLRDVSCLADKYAQLPDGALRSAIREQLQQEAQAESEFSMVVHGYLTQSDVL
jgi:hypothetical protein